MGVKWGAGQPRHRTSISNWKQPYTWNAQAPASEFAGRKGFWPVFCASLSDFCDNEVPQIWRDDLATVIDGTPNLSWLLVTKRIGNLLTLYPQWAQRIPDNVRVMITLTDQEEADRDLPKLMALKCKNGVSYEPALSRINFNHFMVGDGHDAPHFRDGHLDWVIVGGESKQGAEAPRLFNIDWARSTVEQCQGAGVPVFVKQLGSDPRVTIADTCAQFPYAPRIKDRAGADMSEWPADLRVREFPV